MAAGMEVIYSGLRQSTEAIVQAALQEGVDVLGLSILSGAHIPLCQKVSSGLRTHGLEGITWIIGGSIPRQDHDALQVLGVDGIFPTGTPFEEIVEFIEQRVQS
jgi:methylmalonyl-CoA mutase C-terminal domain/subunit